MFSYCFNNPVNMCDPDGNWPSWARKTFDTIKKVVSNTVSKVKQTLNKVNNFVSKHVGTAVNIGKEKTSYKQYYFVATYEGGAGYNKSFSTGKSVNAYTNVPENPFEICEYGSGIDINVNGYGGSLQMGAESGIAIHIKNTSLELGANSLGRIYGKHTYSTGDGYVYNKLSINLPEIAAVVVAAIYIPGVVVTVGAASTSIQMFR